MCIYIYIYILYIQVSFPFWVTLPIVKLMSNKEVYDTFVARGQARSEERPILPSPMHSDSVINHSSLHVKMVSGSRTWACAYYYYYYYYYY